MIKKWKILSITIAIITTIILGFYLYYITYIKNKTDYKNYNTNINKPNKLRLETKKEKKEFLNSLNQKISEEKMKEIKKTQIEVLSRIEKKKNKEIKKNFKLEKEIKKTQIEVLSRIEKRVKQENKK